MKVELENMDEAERKIFKEKVRKVMKFTRGLQAVQNDFSKGFFLKKISKGFKVVLFYEFFKGFSRRAK